HQCCSLKRAETNRSASTSTLSFDVVVIVDGDGDGDVAVGGSDHRHNRVSIPTMRSRSSSPCCFVVAFTTFSTNNASSTAAHSMRSLLEPLRQRQRSVQGTRWHSGRRRASESGA